MGVGSVSSMIADGGQEELTRLVDTAVTCNNRSGCVVKGGVRENVKGDGERKEED